MAEEAYPTAKTSSSVLLCVTTVTWALHAESRHRPRSSPFFTSQQRTSSLAPTIARPAPVWRTAPAVCSSFDQMAFDEAEATSPNVFECSNFLKSKIRSPILPEPNWHLQIRFHHRWKWMGKIFGDTAVGTKINTGGDRDPSGSPTAHDDRGLWHLPTAIPSFPLPLCPLCFSWTIRTC